MLGTYAAALMVIGASVPIGAAVLLVAGRREWSWLAPLLGLAIIAALAWLTVQLPGEGLTALIAIAVAAVLAAAVALPRLDFGVSQLRQGGPVALVALLVVSIPFIVEGQVGVLGTGFNVDMSQHLFTADWIASPLAPPPPLIDQGYPVGPHALAVAMSELSGGNLVNAFSGITIAVPVLAALGALSATEGLGPRRGAVAALLVAIPYLVASFLAQGAFKELFEAALVLGFVLWLAELQRGRGAVSSGLGFALPGAALLIGMIYSYSGPGLLWPFGILVVWGAVELVRDAAAAWAQVLSLIHI